MDWKEMKGLGGMELSKPEVPSLRELRVKPLRELELKFPEAKAPISFSWRKIMEVKKVV